MIDFSNINYKTDWEGFRSNKRIEEYFKVMFNDPMHEQHKQLAKKIDEEVMRMAKETEYKYLVIVSETKTEYKENGSVVMHATQKCIGTDNKDLMQGNIYDLDKVREYIKKVE